MTPQRLYDVLKFLDSLDQNLGIQPGLESVAGALANLVNQPAQPNYQSALASALTSFTAAAAKMTGAITPSQATAIRAMGGAEFFDPAIAEKVTNSIQTNAMTPSVARDFVQDLAGRRSTFLTTVRSTRQGLEKLGISDSGLKPGATDVAFLIPRDIFDNQLGPFAKELTFISRLVQDFAEAQTGETQPVTLEELSSSVPTVTLVADLAALSLLGTVIKKFLDAWEKIEKIRKVRAELAEMGMKGKALEELSEQVTTTVTEVVEESTELVMAKYPGNRKDELSNAIRRDTRRLFGQIERGLTVEFRSGPPPSKAGDNQKELQQVSNFAKELKFPRVGQEPLLLKSAEILEDPVEPEVVHRTSRKTTTHTTASSKKEPPKDGNQ